ncbi:hypothetical protein BCV71DRAFT_224336 [Rhizopus microsporus]|uniref:Uncharacterized protein n=1 Tax=Rhizopus microsporus TaxID=58291 RepID=A0A1X0SF02_RHIZD|nr:hypothetical protein BCV71DRAFT_224336 [Rhizopus microsporus]
MSNEVYKFAHNDQNRLRIKGYTTFIHQHFYACSFFISFFFSFVVFPTSKNSRQDFHASQVYDPGGSRIRFFK